MKIIDDFKRKLEQQKIVDKTLNFNLKFLQEHYKEIYNYKNIKIYDTEHCIERFKQRFKNLGINLLYRNLRLGLDIILKNWNLQANQYVIISKSNNVKIPIHIRPDRKYPHDIIGIIATVLDKNEHEINIKNDIKILIESCKNNKYNYDTINYFNEKNNNYNDWFNIYFEDSQIYYDFEILEID